MTQRYRAVHLSTFDGLHSWGIEDLAYNGDNLVRDWRYKGGAKRRIWRATQEEAVHAARYLSEHPEVLEKDARKASRTGRTGAILGAQRRQRTQRKG